MVNLTKKRFRRAISADINNLLAFKPANLHAEMIRDSVIRSLEVIIETGVVDDTEFISKEVKERASKGVHTLVSKILAEMPAEGTFDAEEIAGFFTAAPRAIGLAEVGWRVVITEDKKLFTTSSQEKIIYIPKKVKKSADDVKRLAAHEIGVHAQKKVTLDDDVEEGVALLVETVVSQSTNNVSVNRARRRYIHEGLALGAIDGVKRNARQVFQITWKLRKL